MTSSTTPDDATQPILHPATVRTIRADVERIRTEAGDSLQRLHASLWEYLAAWLDDETDDDEIAELARLLAQAAEGGEPR